MAKKNQRQKQQRPQRRRMRGRGDYSEEVLDLPPLPPVFRRLEAKIDHIEKKVSLPKISDIAGNVGGALGGRFGMGDLGRQAGSQLAKLMGFGDYNLKANSLIKGEVNGPLVPEFDKHGRGIRVREREFIGNVTSGALSSGASLFNNLVIPINPRNPAFAPWLSQLAVLFDQWVPHGIVFEYVSTSSEYNGAGQALGKVVLATDYDSTDAPYTSAQQAENSDYACVTKPSESILHGVECDVSERPLRTLYVDPSSSTSPLFSTLGNFQISTQGMNTAGTLVGELWVSYDISFYKKQLNPTGDSGDYICTSGATATGGAMFTSGNTVSTSNTIAITQTVGTSSNIIFPPLQGNGRFLVNYFTATPNAADNPFATPVNCTQITARSTGVAPAAKLWSGVFEITAPGAQLKSNVAGGVSAYDLAIQSVSSTFDF